MGASPKFKIFDERGEYQASFKDEYEVARYLSICEEGWSVRLGHSKKLTLFTQKVDADAYWSFDEVVRIMDENARKLGWSL